MVISWSVTSNLFIARFLRVRSLECSGEFDHEAKAFSSENPASFSGDAIRTRACPKRLKGSEPEVDESENEKMRRKMCWERWSYRVVNRAGFLPIIP